MTTSFGDRLAQAVADKQSVAVVGVDPVLEKMPGTLTERLHQADDPQMVGEVLAEFCLGIVEAVADLVPAVKPNIAFFEAFGVEGLMAYNSTCDFARECGLLVIGDVKRGDIGSTAAAYAQGLLTPPPVFDSIDADEAGLLRLGPNDALTLNPYLGSDGIKPFLDAAKENEQGAFLLVRTSDPSSCELQMLKLEGGGTLADAAARLVHTLGEDSIGESGLSAVGAVVGATHPDELDHFRELMPNAPFLVPGYGAQGGSADDVVGAFRADGTGALVNASRSVIYAWQKEEAPGDWQGAARRAAERMNDDLGGALKKAGKWSF